MMMRNGVTKAEKSAKEKEKAPTPAPAPKISIKGKERDTSTPVPQQPAKSKKASPSQPEHTPVNEKKCRDVLKALMKLPQAAIFLQPVDIVRDGCPTYYDEIKHPMDFSTITKKLSDGEYKIMEDFAKDVQLIFSNCRTFNPPNTGPWICADVVDAAWKTAWAKAMEKRLAYNEKRSLQSIMGKLISDPVSWVFREPVDPVALGIPTYFDVIPRKNARDLRTIRQKLDADKYDSIDAFEADLDLMVDNAILFNGSDSEVAKWGIDLRNKYRDLLSPLKNGGTTAKRKNGEKSTPQPTKKARLG
ncbi:hypothetical protein NM688_g8206 [Phlebia brevispora]|uniref:Uncharacterized protein n=1 Tax=Phlebia brevispora TaxID=194682 RepID=A0ACC1RVX7_9APHY|nr:hypothetical protein NM688_g8206 [Phlebia brevispora]